jgi:hypothetical protein
MSLLPQLQTELVSAASRPPRGRRISARVVAVIVAAVAALLIAAPPTVASLPASAGILAGPVSR